MIFTLLDIAHDLIAQLYATGCEHIGYIMKGYKWRKGYSIYPYRLHTNLGMGLFE